MGSSLEVLSFNNILALIAQNGKAVEKHLLGVFLYLSEGYHEALTGRLVFLFIRVR